MLNRTVASFAAIFLSMSDCIADSDKIVNPNNNHTYQRFDTFFTWGNAKNMCSNLGAHLATINDADEDNWVLTHFGSNYWLGGTNIQNSSVWTWITGEPWNYTSTWESGSELGSSRHYLVLGVSLIDRPLWKVRDDFDAHPYLCEWDIPPFNVGGSVINAKIKKIVCKNKTTGQKVTKFLRNATTWDCGEIGLSIKEGDIIDMTLTSVVSF